MTKDDIKKLPTPQTDRASDTTYPISATYHLCVKLEQQRDALLMMLEEAAKGIDAWEVEAEINETLAAIKESK